jgi:SAM-dependent methyltransferase
MPHLKPPRVPAYFDAFLDAVRHGAQIDHVHLGHWDQPAKASDDPKEFETAQTCMAEKLIGLANLRTGQLILDVGCGFGGLARLIDAGFSPVGFIGVNIDPRQLAICKAISTRPGNRFDWIAADACALPFASATFDRIFCVEAIFHFASRSQFLAEAFRVLKPGGRLVLSDILLDRPGANFAVSAALMEECLEAELGPWPDKWHSAAELRSASLACGFSLETEIDASAQTLPSYRTIAPSTSTLTGPAVMRMLHEGSRLTYLYLGLTKPTEFASLRPMNNLTAGRA